MSIMHAVIGYDVNTGREINIVGWSANEPEARELESKMNDAAELLFTDSAAETPLVEYYTQPIQLYGCVHEYKPYGDFDALVRDGAFFAIVPAGWGDFYPCSRGDAHVIHCMNILKGFDSYLA